MPDPIITTSVSCERSRLVAAGGCWSTERAARGRSGRLRLAGTPAAGLKGLTAALYATGTTANRLRSPSAQPERPLSAWAIFSCC